MTKYLAVDEILRLHHQLIEDYGGSHGVRDESRLQSVITAPTLIIFGREQYDDVYQKAAVYARNIIGDHPFVDGNKRTGITVAGIFLLRNGQPIDTEPKRLEDYAITIATHKPDIAAIAEWLRRHGRAAKL